MDNQFKKNCQTLCSQIEYQFQDEELLHLALTHKSFTEFKSKTGQRNNEKLEFLGDAVLDMAISELLMDRFPELDEGGLSKFRASLVNEDGLAHIARKMDLGKCLRMGKGEDLSGGREKSSLLADALERFLRRFTSIAGKLEAFPKFPKSSMISTLMNCRIRLIPSFQGITNQNFRKWCRKA